jgi:PAS domain S-box-containing protein
MDSRNSLILSQREQDILALTMTGLADKEIAANLGISIHTVRTYWDRIREKVGKSTRAEVISEIGHRLSTDSTVCELMSKLAEADSKRYQLEELLGRVPLLVWSCDTSGRIVYVNDQFRDYVGAESIQFISDLYSRITPPDLFIPLHEKAVAARQKQGILEVEAPLRRADGELRWHLIRETPMNTELDEGILRIGTATDIHVLHTREQNWAGRENRTRLAADLADIGIAFYDPATGRSYSNPAYDEMTGTSQIGQDWTEAVHPDDRAQVQGSCKEALDRQAPLDSEHRYVGSNGKIVHALAKVIGLPGNGWLFIGKPHTRFDLAAVDPGKFGQVVVLLEEMLGLGQHSRRRKP